MKKKEIIKNAFYLLNEVSDLKYKLDLEALENKKLRKQLALYDVSVSLPTKDDASQTGFFKADKEGYNYRRVLKDKDNDIYYSGWMDCFEWILKGNER